MPAKPTKPVKKPAAKAKPSGKPVKDEGPFANVPKGCWSPTWPKGFKP